MIRLGILGTAAIARALFRHPAAGVEIGAVASRSAARARAFAEEYGIPRWYGSYEALLEDPSLQAVYIPLPHHLHAEYVRKAAAAGKHVLVEKPAALSSGDVRDMAAACRAHRVVFMEGLMYRFLRIHRRARELAHDGTIGRLRYISYNLSYHARERGRSGFRMDRALGGGALYDLGIYALDFLRFVTGEEPVLKGAFQRREGGDGIDVFTHALYTAGDVIATIAVGFDCDANHYALAGERGSVTSPVALSGRHEPQVLAIHLHRDNRRYEEHFAADTPYAREVEYFASCIRRGEEPEPGADNSLRNMLLLEELFARARPFYP